MITFPKIGTLESLVLAMMLKAPGGVSYLDFPEGHELHNEERLDEIVRNLRNGMFEVEDDNTLRFDS